MKEYEKSPIEIRKNQKEVMAWGAGCSTIIGLFIFLCFAYNALKSISISKDSVVDFQKFGTFGDFVGGLIGTLFSLAGVFLLYLTLKEQRENFDKERLENNFFEMIKFHKENVNELEFTYHENEKDDSRVKAVRRKVFKVIFSHFESLWDELDFIFKNATLDEIYKEKEIQNLKKDKTFTGRNFDLKQIAKIDIVYLIIFFGLSKLDKITIKNLTSNVYKDDFINKVLDFASLKPKRNSIYWNQWERINSISDEKIKTQVIIDFYRKRNNTYSFNQMTHLYFNDHMGSSYYDDNYFRYYGGHQFRLGHYYRHLFQNLSYINNQLYLKYDEKYSYIKILRVQLSNYEQIMLFLNSISQIGRQFEFSKNDINDQLITKYNLITNIPNRFLFETIDIVEYYSLIEFETIKSDLVKKEKIKDLYI
jgi:hypothetical protein